MEKMNEYQLAALRTWGQTPPSFHSVNNAILGLAGEAGELANKWKKQNYHGHEKDTPELIDELGDCLWYIAAIAADLGWTLEAVAQMNIEKLRCRYPDGFSEERSINRRECGG